MPAVINASTQLATASPSGGGRGGYSKIGFNIITRTLAEYLSTTSPFWTYGNAPVIQVRD